MPSLPLFKQTLKRSIAGNLGQCIKQLEASLDQLTDDILFSQSGLLKLEGGPIECYPAF